MAIAAVEGNSIPSRAGNRRLIAPATFLFRNPQHFASRHVIARRMSGKASRELCMQQKNDVAKVLASPAERKAWVTPDVVKIGAGEAELGANPVIGEGFFGKGS